MADMEPLTVQALKSSSLFTEPSFTAPAETPPPLSRPRSQPLPHADFRARSTISAARCVTRPLAATDLAWSEHDLAVRLGQMPVNLAAPLLQSSLPSLDAPTLLAVIATTGEPHHRLIAGRSDLDQRVIKALLKSGHDSVLLALAHNTTASFDPQDQARLTAFADTREDLRQALQARPDFAPAIAPIAATLESLDAKNLGHNNLKLLKLMRAGQMDKAVIEAARRLEVEPTALNRALDSLSAVPLALMTSALGLDRVIFLNLLPYWQAAHGGQPRLKDNYRALLLSIFTLSAIEARQKLAAIMSNLVP